MASAGERDGALGELRREVALAVERAASAQSASDAEQNAHRLVALLIVQGDVDQAGPARQLLSRDDVLPSLLAEPLDLAELERRASRVIDADRPSTPVASALALRGRIRLLRGDPLRAGEDEARLSPGSYADAWLDRLAFDTRIAAAKVR
jgi:hypothetical protein